MSGRIPTSFIDNLVARTDIVEVIGSRIALKRAGKEFKACCPFHGEKTPSFTVVPDKQFYHCFGCGAHGSALGFLMDYDHLGFVEAVEELAAKAGVDIPREESLHASPKPEQSLYTVLEQASELYRKELKRSERAKSYLKQRGLTGETAVRFGIGYAPDAWEWLIQRLATSAESRQQLLQTGLIIPRERADNPNPGHYDRFRDRIMFPIRDNRGRTIGFGGRVLDQGEPKYLNSPETELFHKGRELYGLYEARQATRTFVRMLVVEGYMDVVRLYQAGITYAVATLGTATTDEHLQRLFRVCNELVFCFDGDRAGRAAAWRALENALPQVREGRQIRFLFLPDGEDPDSLVGREGREAFEARLLQAEPLSEYFVRHLAAQVDLRSVDGRAQLSALAQPLIARIAPGVYRDLLIAELAQRVGINQQRLTEIVDRSTPRKNDKPPEKLAPLRRPLLREPSKPSAGRPSLVRQAVHLLVHHPQAAASFDRVASLEPIQQAGIDLLMELLHELQARPCATTGALLERWRDRPHSGALAKLATVECLDSAEIAPSKLNQVLEKLIQEEIPARRCKELLAKASQSGLSPEERLELQTLLQIKSPTSRN